MRAGDPGAGPWIDLETAYRWLETRLVKLYGEDRQPYQRPAGESGAIALGRNAAYSGSS